jgi:hypothetical protein
MNVINVCDVEKRVNCYSARAKLPAVRCWINTVARNHFLGKLSASDIEANFKKYDPNDVFMAKREELPDWAKCALKRNEPLMWFDLHRSQNAGIWNVLDNILLWFNGFSAADPKLKRIDRISFDAASRAAVLKLRTINNDIWRFIRDNPPVVKVYNDFKWVRLTTQLHFEREGILMHHCVGRAGYYERSKNGECTIYSLRDANNEPHVTIEANGDSLYQCKGHSDQRPESSYQPYIKKFIDDMRLKIEGDRDFIN